MPAGELKHSILVVEDEAMVSMLLEDMVLDCGGRIVGTVATFDQALAIARDAEFDVAILDLNLNGTLSYPIAAVLRARGISVIFATGYGAGELLDKFRDCPTLQKPFSQSEFAQSVTAACDLSQAIERSP